MELEFNVTQRIRQSCERCLVGLHKSDELHAELKQVLDTDSSAATIRLSTIKAVSERLKVASTDSSGDIWIHQMLRGSSIHIDKPAIKPRNPELVARLDKIKKQLEEQEYWRMTSNIAVARQNGESDTMLPAVPGVRTGQETGTASVKQEMAAVNRQISVIINIMFSAFGVGFAVWYASYTLTSEMGWRILMALAAAVVVVLAETWLFALSGTRGQKKRLPGGFQGSNNDSRSKLPRALPTSKNTQK
ncbi:hypothetical protein GGI15_002906 [Coemansia interrupta]|uniref:Endoplasmic reticulum-based factor for assembly of V-ATPase-domain-containing protein n=1 Tax=Coemansia interrupta TaxID=1126814 RepID=A0A9W8HFM2_9FUNG|nr:hypothetical protein GGI15_002906 [Coemansia interrupta]